MTFYSSTALDDIDDLRFRLQETEKERDCLREERDRYREALQALLKEARLYVYADQSKHLRRECEDARKVLEGKE